MIQAPQLKGALVTASVINAIAKGIVMANDLTILIEHGGYLSLTYDWDRNVLFRMEREGKEMTTRMATTEKIPVGPGLLLLLCLKCWKRRMIECLKEERPDTG